MKPLKVSELLFLERIYIRIQVYGDCRHAEKACGATAGQRAKEERRQGKGLTLSDRRATEGGR